MSTHTTTNTKSLASTKKALAATQRSTASLGKFDQSRQHEPEKKKAITRKKFSDNMVVGNKEREKSEMKILDNVINGVGVNASNKTKNKNARGTAYDHEMSERGGGGNDGFRKKKGRAGQVSERSERALMKKRILAMNPAKWQQTATSTTKLTLFHPIRLTHFTRFARLSLKMRLASLVAGENVQGDKKVNKVINRFTSLSL